MQRHACRRPAYVVMHVADPCTATQSCMHTVAQVCPLVRPAAAAVAILFGPRHSRGSAHPPSPNSLKVGEGQRLGPAPRASASGLRLGPAPRASTSGQRLGPAPRACPRGERRLRTESGLCHAVAGSSPATCGGAHEPPRRLETRTYRVWGSASCWRPASLRGQNVPCLPDPASRAPTRRSQAGGALRHRPQASWCTAVICTGVTYRGCHGSHVRRHGKALLQLCAGRPWPSSPTNATMRVTYGTPHVHGPGKIAPGAPVGALTLLANLWGTGRATCHRWQ